MSRGNPGMRRVRLAERFCILLRDNATAGAAHQAPGSAIGFTLRLVGRESIRRAPGRATGFTLVPALILLLAVSLLGSAVTQWVGLAARSVQGDRQHQIAFQAAAAALDDAVRDMVAVSSGQRAAVFRNPAAAPAWPEQGCGSGALQGLCAVMATRPMAQDAIGDDAWRDPQASVPFGSFTGASYPAGEGAQAAATPRYRIARLAATQPGDDHAPSTVYRVTALGTGPRPARMSVVLQADFTLGPQADATATTSSLQARQIAFRQFTAPAQPGDD